jgi:hypothetical protein
MDSITVGRTEQESERHAHTRSFYESHGSVFTGPKIELLLDAGSE